MVFSFFAYFDPKCVIFDSKNRSVIIIDSPWKISEIWVLLKVYLYQLKIYLSNKNIYIYIFFDKYYKNG